MPGVSCFQSNVAYYSVAGSGGDLPCAYIQPNGGGTIGLAWVTTADATTPSSVDDSNDNEWFLLQTYPSSLGTQTWWVCPVLNSGVNTVTAHGLTGNNGGPNFVLLEYSPPCGGVSIMAFGAAALSSLVETAIYNASNGMWYYTLIAGLWYASNATESVIRTWDILVQGNALNYGVRQTLTMPGTNFTGLVADCTMPYPYPLNTISFNYTPFTPALGSDWVFPTGILLSTQA
jgi:hypothetical protein